MFEVKEQEVEMEVVAVYGGGNNIALESVIEK